MKKTLLLIFMMFISTCCLTSCKDAQPIKIQGIVESNHAMLDDNPLRFEMVLDTDGSLEGKVESQMEAWPESGDPIVTRDWQFFSGTWRKDGKHIYLTLDETEKSIIARILLARNKLIVNSPKDYQITVMPPRKSNKK